MSDATFTFRVDGELKAVFTETAKSQDRTAAQLLRLLMREEVQREREAREHDAWFREEVERAVREADDPNVRRVPNAAVRSTWRQQRATLMKRSGRRTA